MRIAVTGGAGTVGRSVVGHALAEGHTVVEIDRPSAPAAGTDRPAGPVRRPADVTDYPALLRALDGCEALVHLAAYPKPWDEPDHVVHNHNVTASYNALRAAAELEIARVCLASSVNAIGGGYSRKPRFDYFPLDERHPSYNEDPYSLSKWLGEVQADSFARRYGKLSIASLRLHAVTPARPAGRAEWRDSDLAVRDLWGYTLARPAARACLLALTADFAGHQVCYVVAPKTTSGIPSEELRREYYPEVPVRGELRGNQGFFDCTKAERLLGWRHDE
ncbi:NAD(P)-dependent oxidoreductase [Plantactinospora sp. KLBMP9567]|uniref:NAD-dependent epimerase/dehydratase family protein n=1 Tax=Plantactinospora sp. KLBMP9567 TaxID=3085900 RepID=UPI0029827F97|nr:NAD(P)-dependent oxidoreductase [Plantactinospora sp. KLBMP9567]MDW5327539.1 NAD(P)-dependent oxidoreductase [Plantactinospora sp. KLBMP9567]